MTPDELTILRQMIANETPIRCGALLVGDVPIEVVRSLIGKRFIDHFCAWEGSKPIGPCYYITTAGKAALAEIEAANTEAA